MSAQVPTTIGPDELGDFTTEVLQRLQVPADDAALLADSLVQAELWGTPPTACCGCPGTSSVCVPAPCPRSTTATTVRTPARWWCSTVSTASVRSSPTAPHRGDRASTGSRHQRHRRTQLQPLRDGRLLHPTSRRSRLHRAAVHQRKPCHGSLGRTGQDDRNQPVVDRRTRRASRRRRHRPGQHRRGTRQDLPRSRTGRAIPDGWAADGEGVRTNDAQVGIEGLILPMAGPKGYVIAFMMDVLAGVLTGSALRRRGRRALPARPAQRLRPPAAHHRHRRACRSRRLRPRMEQLIDDTKASTGRQGTTRSSSPASSRTARATGSPASGITLAQNTWTSLSSWPTRPARPRRPRYRSRPLPGAPR